MYLSRVRDLFERIFTQRSKWDINVKLHYKLFKI